MAEAMVKRYLLYLLLVDKGVDGVKVLDKLQNS